MLIARVWLGMFIDDYVYAVISIQCIVFFNFSLGEGCSHKAALKFKVECAMRLGYTSPTSQHCSWNETYC